MNETETLTLEYLQSTNKAVAQLTAILDGHIDDMGNRFEMLGDILADLAKAIGRVNTAVAALDARVAELEGSE